MWHFNKILETTWVGFKLTNFDGNFVHFYSETITQGLRPEKKWYWSSNKMILSIPLISKNPRSHSVIFEIVFNTHFCRTDPTCWSQKITERSIIGGKENIFTQNSKDREYFAQPLFFTPHVVNDDVLLSKDETLQAA